MSLINNPCNAIKNAIISAPPHKAYAIGITLGGLAGVGIGLAIITQHPQKTSQLNLLIISAATLAGVLVGYKLISHIISNNSNSGITDHSTPIKRLGLGAKGGYQQIQIENSDNDQENGSTSSSENGEHLMIEVQQSPNQSPNGEPSTLRHRGGSLLQFGPGGSLSPQRQQYAVINNSFTFGIEDPLLTAEEKSEL